MTVAALGLDAGLEADEKGVIVLELHSHVVLRFSCNGPGRQNPAECRARIKLLSAASSFCRSFRVNEHAATEPDREGGFMVAVYRR